MSPPARKPAKYSDDEENAGGSSSGDEDDDDKPLAAKGRAKAAAKKTPASAGAKKPVVRGKVGYWGTGRVASAKRRVKCGATAIEKCAGAGISCARDQGSWEAFGGYGV